VSSESSKVDRVSKLKSDESLLGLLLDVMIHGIGIDLDGKIILGGECL
jgi:hypothetical protein